MVFVMIKKLVEIKNKLKAKKPTFLRHDIHKKKRLSKIWRKPKGRQNKMRLHRKGYAKGRSTGYGSPKEVRGLTKEGYRPNVVVSKKDFADLDNTIDAIIISRTLGLRRKKDLVAFAKENKFKVLNLDEIKLNKKLEDLIAKKKAKRESFQKKKVSKEKAKDEVKNKKQKETKKEESNKPEVESPKEDVKETKKVTNEEAKK